MFLLILLLSYLSFVMCSFLTIFHMGTVIVRNEMVVFSEVIATEASNDSDNYVRIFHLLFIIDKNNFKMSLPVVTIISCCGYAIVKYDCCVVCKL